MPKIFAFTNRKNVGIKIKLKRFSYFEAIKKYFQFVFLFLKNKKRISKEYLKCRLRQSKQYKQ